MLSLSHFATARNPWGISPEQLASAAVADLVERPADDFTRAASKVLSKNAELYRRLAR
jgi:antitoxin FitA